MPQSNPHEAVAHGFSTAAKRPWEDRPNWVCCFPPRNPKSEKPPDFTGVTVIDGRKFWINVYKRLDKNQARYVSVHVKPWEEGGV